jgi:hypothetical protein
MIRYLMGGLSVALMILAYFRDVADGTKDIVSENWLVSLFRELEKQGITLPER